MPKLNIYYALKGSYINKKYIKKDLTIRYTYWYWIKKTQIISQVYSWPNAPLSILKNLCGAFVMQEANIKNEQILKANSWQPRVLTLQSPKQNYWLINSATTIYVCNNLRLMTDFAKKSTRIGGSILNRVLPDQGTVWIRLALEAKIKRIILNFYNIYYRPNRSSNLISLNFFNNNSIYYDNKQQVLYNKVS